MRALFQDGLNKMRSLDDKIIYALNTSIPTDSFRSKVDAPAKCKDLFSQIQTGHAQREIAIKKCIISSADKVKILKDKKERANDDIELLKHLKAEQTKVSVRIFHQVST